MGKIAGMLEEETEKQQGYFIDAGSVGGKLHYNLPPLKCERGSRSTPYQVLYA